MRALAPALRSQSLSPTREVGLVNMLEPPEKYSHVGSGGSQRSCCETQIWPASEFCLKAVRNEWWDTGASTWAVVLSGVPTTGTQSRSKMSPKSHGVNPGRCRRSPQTCFPLGTLLSRHLEKVLGMTKMCKQTPETGEGSRKEDSSNPRPHHETISRGQSVSWNALCS